MIRTYSGYSGSPSRRDDLRNFRASPTVQEFRRRSFFRAFSSVRECICACQAGCPRTEVKLSTLPQVSGTLGHALGGQDVFVITVLALALVAAVVLTAVWSPDKERRKDALAVFDRITRWRW
jgi:hypothetical protein